jgi:hypothetical protein
MNRSRQQLISDLSADLTPVPRPGQPDRLAMLWLMGAALGGILALLALGPFRAGSVVALGVSPRYAIESLLGFVAIAMLGVYGLRLAVPNTGSLTARVAPPLVVLAAWVALYVYGLHDPALPLSMVGKRAHCLVEGLVFGASTLVIGLLVARRLWPLRGAWTGLLLGLAAGALPALVMQFACIVVPTHTLIYHVLPGLAMGGLGAVLGALLLRPS